MIEFTVNDNGVSRKMRPGEVEERQQELNYTIPPDPTEERLQQLQAQIDEVILYMAETELGGETV